MADDFQEELSDAVQSESLRRDNAMLVKIVGGLGVIVLGLIGTVFTLWLNTISGKFDAQQAQISRQWDVLNQRAERINAIENRLGTNDAMTFKHEDRLRDMERDHERIKVRLKMDGN